MTESRKFRDNGGLQFDKLVSIPLALDNGEKTFLKCVTLLDANGYPIDLAGDGLRVFVTNASSGGGMASMVDVTDRAGRIVGLVGATITADMVGLALDSSVQSVWTRLADGSLRIGGTVAIAGAVTGPLTDAQLRAAAVPMSAASLPLPTGAATETTLATLATDAGLASVFARLGDGSTHVAVDSLPLGLATSAKQDTGNGSLASIDAKLPTLVIGRVPVDGSGVTQPVSGPLTDAQLRAAAVPVSGTFWQATQPVSAASLPLPTGASTEATLALIKAKTDNLDVALSTRAVTGLTDTQLRASAVPVSAATLPLPTNAAQDRTTAASPHACRLSDGAAFIDPRSIRALTSGDQITVANVSIAVTGTFWQATQPVSGPLTDTQLRASAVPVSGTVTANIGTSGSLALDATLTGGTQKAIVRGGAKGATTAADITSTAEGADHQAIDVQLYHGGTAKDPTQTRALTSADVVTAAQGAAAAAGAPWACRLSDGAAFYAAPAAAQLPAALVGGRLDGNVGAWLGSTAPTVGSKTSANSVPVVIASDQAAVAVTPPTITKGTQGATGFTTQDLKDSGRVLKTYTVSGLACVTSEALISLTPYADLVAAGAATTFPVTAGKRLRIQKITVTVRCTSTVNVGGIVRLRLLAGTVLVGSPVHDSLGCMGSNLATAVIGNAQSFSLEYPDGLELSGNMQFGLTQLFSATTATIDVHVTGYEY